MLTEEGPDDAIAIGAAERAHYVREMLAMGLPANADGDPVMVMGFLVRFADVLGNTKLDGSEAFSPDLATAPNGALFESFREGVFYRMLVIHAQRLGTGAMSADVSREYDRLVGLYGLPAVSIGRSEND